MVEEGFVSGQRRESGENNNRKKEIRRKGTDKKHLLTTMRIVDLPEFNE